VEFLFARDLYLKALNEKNYPEAVREALNGLLEGESLSWVSREVTRLRRFLGADRCIELVQDWVREHPGTKGANVVLGQLYLDEERLEEASMALRKAEDEQGLLRLADRLSYEGLYELGLDVLNGLPEAQRNELYHQVLGRTLRGLGRYEEAVLAFRRVYEMGGKFGGEALHELVGCYLENLNDPRAVLELTPIGGDDLTGYRAQALFLLGETDSALALFEAGGERTRTEHRFFQGKLLFLLGRAVEADSVLKEFIKGAPDARDVTEALFYLEVITSLGTTDGFSNYVELERNLALKRFDDVISHAREHVAQEPDTLLRALEKFTMARALACGDRAGEAIEFFREVGRESPTYVGARSLFEAFRAAESVGNPDLGKDILRELILEFPDSPYAKVARSYL
jgi:tetratricopeptide (TPR) repeat protein